MTSLRITTTENNTISQTSNVTARLSWQLAFRHYLRHHGGHQFEHGVLYLGLLWLWLTLIAGLSSRGLRTDPLTGQQQRVRRISASLPLHPQNGRARVHFAKDASAVSPESDFRWQTNKYTSLTTTITSCGVAFLSSFSLVFSPLAVFSSVVVSFWNSSATLRRGVSYVYVRPHIVAINRLQRSRFNCV